ncbi:MAG: ATP phosphoribosyltransferase regulatory subunit [Eubacterium sp.]|nr:ATP phosphoribosyltransferase regulatory subunit [Eubacterium sp.]
MKKYSKITPEGSRDYLFEECDDRRKVERILADLFKENDYRKVLTPSIEFFDVFESDKTGISADEMFKLTDSKGRTTVLRPDNTMPIARMVATRLGGENLPVRLYYNQNVFVRGRELYGVPNEIAQSGVELIGDGSMKADVEVITMAANCLSRCDLNSYKIEIGNAAFFNSILEKMDIDGDTKKQICKLIEGKNYAALGDLLDMLGDSPETQIIRKLPRLFGGVEVIKEAKKLYHNRAASKALDYLSEVYEALCGAGLGECIMLDLGLVNRSNYYTGVIFHGYAEGSGLTVLSGGRYDNLLGEFGMDAPAIGFAVEVSALCEAMREVINVERPLRIALTKGRLEKSSVKLFKTMGLDTTELENKGRRLILPVDKYEAVLSKAPDVITYVEHGVCDIGIVGKDTIVEHGSSFYEVLDLGIGKCRFALACPKGEDFFSGYKRKTVASKYPKVAKEFFESKGMDVAVIKIEGSVELAPLLGLADGIVDIVETGSTLKENGLEVVEEISPISARVIVNMASMKLRKAEIEAFLNDLELASKV